MHNLKIQYKLIILLLIKTIKLPSLKKLINVFFKTY